MATALKLVLLLLIPYIKAAVLEIPTENLTHITRHSFYDPTVLKSQNQLIYVSYPKVNSDVIIKLESQVITNELNSTCDILVFVPMDRDYLSPEAKVLGNNKLVVGLIETFTTGTQLQLKFFIIDFKEKCKHDNFTITFDDEILQFYKPFKIIPYDDTFDVFVASLSHCQPPGSMCLVRFNLKGDKIRTLNFNFKTNETNYDLVKLSPLIEFDPNSGYAYVTTETSSLKILNSNLRVRKQKRLSGYIRASSILNNDIGICYHVESNNEPRIECVKYDQRLKVKASYSLANSMFSTAKRLYNLADGSSLLVSISRGKIDTRIKRLGLDGRVSRTEEFSYECESFLTDPIDRFVELKGRNYCFSFQCKYNMITHCLTLADTPNLSFTTSRPFTWD